MKLIFAVLDVLLTMGLTRCYKTEGFFTFILSKRQEVQKFNAAITVRYFGFIYVYSATANLKTYDT